MVWCGWAGRGAAGSGEEEEVLLTASAGKTINGWRVPLATRCRPLPPMNTTRDTAHGKAP